MQCVKEDIVEPMELDNTNIVTEKNVALAESQTTNVAVDLIEEAKLMAEKLNVRLKSLNKEDAELFMQNFERNVVLLPKKEDIIKKEFQNLTTQTSEESSQDFVMVNDDGNKTFEDQHTTSAIIPKEQLFGQSAKPSQNIITERFSPKMFEERQNEPKVEKKNDANHNIFSLQQNLYKSTGESSQKDTTHLGIHRTSNYLSNRSMSAERKEFSSSDHRTYSDAVKSGKYEHSTTFPATHSSSENKSQKYFVQNTSRPHHFKSERKDEPCSVSKYKPRSASNHATHRYHNMAEKEKVDYSFHQSHSKPVHDMPATKSHPITLQSIQTQVVNVSQQKTDWLEGSSTLSSFQSNNKKSINILVLGQTGVGKSTWINAFANYLTYSTLENAIAAEAPVCVIPTKFSMFDDNYQRHEILLGQDNNEVFSDEGQSATQNAKTYLLQEENYNVYIIDTPGMDDTRGNEQDDENVKKILRAVAPFKELHAICFLFKANEPRLTQSFKYCISKLLANLSKSALNNTCFVFTNARGTFYKPGDTMGPLKAYFKELYDREGLSVTINDANTFCLDNEAFRFICAYFSKIKFGDHELKTYADSWRHSSNEIIRLLNHAARLRPHSTSETLSINETRTWILQLVKPIIDVSSIIRENLQHLDERLRDLETTRNNIVDLQKRAALPITAMETILLNKPQTVCGNSKCIRYEEISGKWQQMYETVCHKDCTIEQGDLKSCCVFVRSNYCCKCQCSIKDHLRIYYKQRVVTKHLEAQAIQNSLASEVDASKFKRKLIKRCQGMINGYMQESDFVMNAMATFSLFLYQNGISQKVDIFEKHLEKLIEAEETMLRTVQQCSDKTYNQLIDILLRYRDIRDHLIHNKSASKISLLEIQDIRQKLFSMPLTGATIAEVFEIHVDVDKYEHAQSITVCDKQSIMKQFFKWTKETAGRVVSFLGGGSQK